MASAIDTAFFKPQPATALIAHISKAQTASSNLETLIEIMSEWSDDIDDRIRDGQIGFAREIAQKLTRLSFVAIDEIRRLKGYVEESQDEVDGGLEFRII